MSDRSNDLVLSKKGQREVTPFMGHELLYDYLCSKLDDERKKAVEDHLKFSRDAQMDLAKIQNGQSYAERLSKTVVSQPIIEQISEEKTYLSELLQKSNFEKWPVGFKWGLEALAAVSVIVLVLTLAPWEKLMKVSISPGSKDAILAEVTKEKSNTEAVADKKDDSKYKYADEGAPVVASTPVTIPSVELPPAAKVAENKKEETKKPATKEVKVAAAAAAATETNKNVAAERAQETLDAAKPQSGGFLYRGGISITNIEMVGPKVTEKILEFGGRKAGDVELGWKKTDSSMYYHFTIPEAKYQDLITYLSAYGKLKISKEKHPRVMPDGIIRLIITVDESK